MIEALLRAYSKYNEIAYSRILAKAPKNVTTANERWPTGFVSSKIKLVTKKYPGGMSYQEVDIPGKSSKGSRAWRAWIVIKALHEGWKKRPFVRRPTRKKALAFPVMQETRVVRRRGVRRRIIVTPKAVQKKQITLNPWISLVWKELEPFFERYLKGELEKERHSQRVEKVR